MPLFSLSGSRKRRRYAIGCGLPQDDSLGLFGGNGSVPLSQMPMLNSMFSERRVPLSSKLKGESAHLRPTLESDARRSRRAPHEYGG